MDTVLTPLQAGRHRLVPVYASLEAALSAGAPDGLGAGDPPMRAVILPVQYYVRGHRLAVCLGHHSIPARSLNETIIAFTADAIDPAARSGWAVQIQGRSSIPLLDGFDTACGQPAAGQIVEIEPGTITGYYVPLCPFIDALLAGRQASA